METAQFLEWIGYIGSIIVAISLTMTSMVKLRWTNLVGALIFTIYGIAINAIPVALVNGFITLIDLYYLVKIYNTKEFFKLMSTEKNNPYILHFLKYYQKAIRKDFPDFETKQAQVDVCILTLRNMDIAGLFMAHKNGDELVIDLDYATPQYQDFKTGRFLFDKNSGLFKNQGIKQLSIAQLNKQQKPYYKRMGFELSENNVYIKAIL